MARGVAVFVAVLVGAATVAAVSAQESVRPPLYEPGDVTSAGMGVNPETGEVAVGFEVTRVLTGLRYAGDGTNMDQWSALISRNTSAVTVNGRTRELYEASTVRGAISVTRWRDNGVPIETWDTGFTGMATDIDAEPWGGEVVIGQHDGTRLLLLTLSRDGSLLSSWSSGYADDAACVTLTSDRRTFVGLAAAEGEGGRIARYDDLGSRTAEWAVPERPAALAVGTDGSLYVATRTTEPHRGSVLVLTDYGTVREAWPLGARPVDIEVGSDGRVHLLLLRAQGRGLQVVELGPDGAPRRSWMALMRLILPNLG